MTDAVAVLPWWREPTRNQWLAFAAAWFGWVLDAFDFSVYVLVIPEIMKEFGVDKTASTVSIALTLLVRLLGGVAAGWASDRWGRKLPLLVSVFWFAACDAAIAFAPGFTAVLVLRTLFGFGMGAEWTAGATLAMENWPQRSRGLASGLLQGGWAVGYFLAALVAGVVVPALGWRALFLVAAAPALLMVPLLALVKETPRATVERQAGGAGFVDLVRTPGVPGRLAWGSAVLALGFAAYYGLIVLYPSLLQGELRLSKQDVATHVALFNVGMLVGAVFCGWLATRRGVAFAILVPTLAMAACTPLYVGAVPSLLWLGALLGGIFGAGYSGTTPLMLTSLFPEPLRAKGVGLAYHLGALAAAFSSPLIAAMNERLGLSLAHAMGLVVAGCVLALAALVTFGPAEVKAPPAR